MDTLTMNESTWYSSTQPVFLTTDNEGNATDTVFLRHIQHLQRSRLCMRYLLQQVFTSAHALNIAALLLYNVLNLLRG